MATRFVEKYITCPFYTDKIEKDIICEGPCGSTRTILRFTSRDEIREWLIESCSHNYELCPVYRMIMREKYAKEKL